MTSTTSGATLRDRLAGVVLTSRVDRHRALGLVEAALDAGDLAFAEAVSRRILGVDIEHEDACALLVSTLLRQGRPAEAAAVANAVLAHFRLLHRRQSVEHGLLLLASRGCQPQGVVDVGAYHGDFALLARQVWPQAAVLMVEPQAAKHELLAALAARLGPDCAAVTALLGDREQAACAFHQTSTPFGSTGSSLYPELSEHARTVVTMPMRTLDGLLAAAAPRRFELLKLDVQGAELDVLRGATATLPGVQVLFLELSLQPVNQGAPLFAAVVQELDRLGFAVFDLLPQPRQPAGLLVQTDAIFVRKTAPFWGR